MALRRIVIELDNSGSTPYDKINVFGLSITDENGREDFGDINTEQVYKRFAAAAQRAIESLT